MMNGRKIFARHSMKRAAAFFLITVMTAGLLSGCQEKDDGKNTVSKGRYVEEDIELPVKEGDEILNIIKSKDGNPVLFICENSTRLIRSEYKDGNWEQIPLEWVNELYGEGTLYFQEVQEAADGTQIVRGMSEDALTHIARSTDGKTGAELNIPYLSQMGEYGYPAVTGLQIDGNGNYWMNDFYDSKVLVISSETFEVLEEINCAQVFSGEQRVLYAAEDGCMAVNTEDGVFTLYDTGFHEQERMKTDQDALAWMCSEGDIWYQISEKGIERMAPGNEVTEVVMDGSMGRMSQSSNVVRGMIAGADGDFYVLYRQEKASSAELVHYVYNKELPSVPEHTLKVFGLVDNQTVQGAVVGFQKSHPDIRVEFQTAENEDISMDDIRTLNTELLSGNGADVILLDGLPADAYVEKGILMDLTELEKELADGEEYLETMLKNTAEKDGKIYGIPVKFSIPIIYGNEEVKQALHSLGELSDYLEMNPESSVFGLADKRFIRDFLFQMYQDELLSTDGKVDTEKMAALLELEKKIAVNAKSEIFDDASTTEMSMGTAGSIFKQGMFSNQGSPAILNHPEGAATDQIDSVTNMLIPYEVMRRLNLSPETLKDFYVPKGIIGINKNTKQRETAEEFVKYLFSKEVQSAQVDDGFPILNAALEEVAEEADSKFAEEFTVMSSWQIEGEGVLEIEAGYPSRGEVEALTAMCRTLKNPARQNFVIWNIYQTEADQCLEGSIDAQTAAENIAQKVDTYLAE